MMGWKWLERGLRTMREEKWEHIATRTAKALGDLENQTLFLEDILEKSIQMLGVFQDRDGEIGRMALRRVVNATRISLAPPDLVDGYTSFATLANFQNLSIMARRESSKIEKEMSQMLRRYDLSKVEKNPEIEVSPDEECASFIERAKALQKTYAELEKKFRETISPEIQKRLR